MSQFAFMIFEGAVNDTDDADDLYAGRNAIVDLLS